MVLIEMLFGLWNEMDIWKHVLHGGAHCRNLVNTIEPTVCSGDVPFLSSYFGHLCISIAVILGIKLCDRYH